MRIRPYADADRDAGYDVCVRTADAGDVTYPGLSLPSAVPASSGS